MGISPHILNHSSENSKMNLTRRRSQSNHRQDRIKRWLFFTLLDYLGHSQIHGYKVIICKTRPYVDRAMWAMLALLNIIFTIWLIASIFFRLIRTPTVISQIAEQVAIQEVEFPAIVLCSENRISHKALLNYSEFM